MKDVLLKTYNNIGIFALIEEGEVKIYSVENNDGAVAFTDLLDAVDYFNHLKELSRSKLFNDSKEKLIDGNTVDEDIVFIDAENED